MVWIDLETCGLRPEDRILEVGIQVTNRYGEERATFQSVVGYSDFILGDGLGAQQLPPEVYDMHTKNHLIEEVLIASTWVANEPSCGFRRNDVETRVLQFLADAFEGDPVEPLPMAGASVQFDRAGLKSQMPRLHNWFHYRQYDVSTILALAHLSGNSLNDGVQRRGIHRAVPDIEDEVSVHKWAMSNLVVQV